MSKVRAIGQPDPASAHEIKPWAGKDLCEGGLPENVCHQPDLNESGLAFEAGRSRKRRRGR
jgi:hypothetical protein